MPRLLRTFAAASLLARTPFAHAHVVVIVDGRISTERASG
jgi:hypothetical protein